SPSKKFSVRRSATRLAVCSSPIAKVARCVLGVSVVVIENFGCVRCGTWAVVAEISLTCLRQVEAITLPRDRGWSSVGAPDIAENKMRRKGMAGGLKTAYEEQDGGLT